MSGATGGKKLHRASGAAMVALSAFALLTIVVGANQPPQPDEGSMAHLFQIAVALVVPAFALFVGTAAGARRPRIVITLAVTGVLLLLAFGILYRMEHGVPHVS